MTRLAIIAAAAIASAVASPAQSQDREAEIRALRSELDQTRATLLRLEKQLDLLQRSPGAPAGSSAPQGAPSEGTTPVVDLTRDEPDNVRATPATTPALAGWELAPPGPIDRPLAPPREGTAAALELAAGTGGGRASFALTRSKDRDTGPPTGGATTAINDMIGLTFSAPLSKDGDTPFATLDGLASGTKLEFEFSRFQGRIPTQASDDAHPLLQAARRDCLQRVPPYKPGCVRLDQAFLDEFMSPEEQDRYKHDYARRSLQRSFAWSLRAAIGYDEFAFYPEPALAKSTVERLSFSAGGGIAFYPWRRTSIGLDLDYERSFKAATAKTSCPIPAPGETIVSCVPGPLTGPARTDQLIVAPELRFLAHLSDAGLIRNLGFAPRVEVDLLTGNLAFDLPVYFAADEKSGLIGGARFGWLSDEKDFKFGIFVGKRFSIFR